ncbi:hypothetical protein IJJ18_02270 [Candidatus Saccharibacteria bacterium]|nr:hypothetical protein [Candidatus Saccharibacteria bacterium]
MIYVLSGSDRVKIGEAVVKILGASYEVFEGSELNVQDLMNIFRGTTLFSKERKILIKDLTPAPSKKEAEGSSEADSAENVSAPGGDVDYYAELLEYVDTPHTVVIWETNLSRKKSYKDFIKSPKVQTKKYDAMRPADAGVVFEILDTARFDGPAAVRMVEKIKKDNDPYMFFGLLVSQALKKGDRRVLKGLSDLDMQMKTSTIEPWALISSFLLQVSSL